MSADIDWAAVAAEAKRKIAQWQASLELAEEMMAANRSTLPANERTPAGMLIGPGAYLGMNIPDAAKRYLEVIRSDQTIRQIADALQQGGLRHVNPKAVYTALWRRRSPDGEFAQPTDSTWGLAEWYRNTPSFTKRRAKAASAKAPEDDAEPETATVADSAPPRTRRGTSQLDHCENFLRAAGTPQHINFLLSKLAGVGKETNVHGLSSTLRQDARKRFENLGKNIWALSEWPESVKADYRARKEPALPL